MSRGARLHFLGIWLCILVNGGLFVFNYVTLHESERWLVLSINVSAVGIGLWALWMWGKTKRIEKL